MGNAAVRSGGATSETLKELNRDRTVDSFIPTTLHKLPASDRYQYHYLCYRDTSLIRESLPPLGSP